MPDYNANGKFSNRNQYGSSYKGGYGGKKQDITLPEGYLKGGYYNDPEKEKLKPEYIVKYPKEIVRGFEKEGKGNGNKRSQIRKYYEYLLRIEKKMINSDNDFSIVEADLQDLISKATYAKGRGVVTKIFEQFIERNVEAVKDEKDLRAFKKHFESVIAFTKKDR